MSTDRPEDAEDWPLRDWSARLRPPSGPGGASEAEILYDDDEVVDDLMDSCFDISLTAEVLRNHGGGYYASCSSSTYHATIAFSFTPQ